MNTIVMAYLGGLVGAVLMDFTESLAARFGLTSGVNVALLGRWALGMTRGQWTHGNIAQSNAQPGEVHMGWAFHFLIGGGGVGLLYVPFAQLLGFTSPTDHLWGGPMFGAMTSVLPWLVLMPAFGWGWFGVNAPKGSNVLVASTLSHLPYGLGLGVVMALGSHS